MVLAERLAAGHGDDDLFVIGWREELGLSYLGSHRPQTRSRHNRAAVTSPPSTLAFLAHYWGDAYMLSPVRNRQVALCRDDRYFLSQFSMPGND